MRVRFPPEQEGKDRSHTLRIQGKISFMSGWEKDRTRNGQSFYEIGVQEMRSELGPWGFLTMRKGHSDLSPGFEASSQSMAEFWV